MHAFSEMPERHCRGKCVYFTSPVYAMYGVWSTEYDNLVGERMRRKQKSRQHFFTSVSNPMLSPYLSFGRSSIELEIDQCYILKPF